jgi:ABC-2 type transport system ATP-binding protein
MSAAMALEAENLTKRYDNGVLAVNNLNLKVGQGEIYTLLGSNGAGKTSTMMMMLGFTDPTSGTTRVCGVDVVKDPLKAKKHVAYVSENVMLYSNFTALQNLEFFGKLGGATSAAIAKGDEILDRVGLVRGAHRRRVGGFSKGMRQRLGIAIAILKNTEVIILDEPTSGLDPKGATEFLEIIQQLKAEGKSIFMSSHDIFRAKVVSDRVGFMNSGKILREVTREEMKNEDLEELYLKYEVNPNAAGTAA